MNLKDLFDAAVRAQRSGRLNEAGALYRQVLGWDRSHLPTLSNLGQLLGQMKEYAQAEELLRQALKLAPRNADAHAHLAAVFYEQNRFAEAIDCCEKGLALAPGNKQLPNILASSLAGAGRNDEAIALLTRMTAAHPGFAPGHYFLGTLLAKQGHGDEALARFKRASEINPRDGVSLAAAGECLMVDRRAAEAIDYLDKALRVNSYDVRSLALKTLALAELGRQDEERWLSDPQRVVHSLHFSELGYSADAIAALNVRLSAFASNEPSLREDPPEYSTIKAWHSTTNLAEYADPVLDEFKARIADTFERRLSRLPEEDPTHPFVVNAPRKYHLDLWAIKMRDGSKLLPHIHADGWLSGVYYVDVPSIVDDPDAGQAGWLKFGAPRVDIALTREPITRTVKPQPGLMLTFPSYIWHDTVPLPPDNDEQRLCLAFDLHPLRG